MSRAALLGSLRGRFAVLAVRLSPRVFTYAERGWSVSDGAHVRRHGRHMQTDYYTLYERYFAPRGIAILTRLICLRLDFHQSGN